jgi:serine/threonine protein kinase
MGTVFLAGDPERPVAVKTMRAADLSDSSARARFRAEAKCARLLSTSATAQVIDDGSDEPVPYLVTEYVSGPTLAQVVTHDGPLAVDALYAVAIGVADALAEIHRAGIVHRDVKPSNVLLAEDGPKIIDFGIARQVDTTGGVTQTGMVMGSPGWVAPERLTGGPATTAADVFCWGMLIAYAATGRHPFGSGEVGQVSERILTLSPDLTRITEPLRVLVEAALAKEPAARPEAAEIRNALMAPRSEPTASQAVKRLWTPPSRRRSRLHRLIPAGPVMACAAGATAALLLLLRGVGPVHFDSVPTPTVTVVTSVPRQAGPGQTGPGHARPGHAGPSKAVAVTRQPTPSVPSATSRPSGTPAPTPTPSSPSPAPSASSSAPTPEASSSAPEASATSTKKAKKPKKPKKTDAASEDEVAADRAGTDFG